MNATVRLWPLLKRQLIPTRLQALLAAVAGLAVLLVAQSDTILTRLGLNNAAYVTAGKALTARFDVVLGSQLAANVVLVTFWATVGLMTYLIVWSVFNIVTDLRNKVTLETVYTNRGHWRGVWETIALKSVSLAALVGLMATFKYTLSLWITLTSPASGQPFVQSADQSIGAWAGLSIEIYLIYLLVILLVTPWYRDLTFTD